MFGVAEIVTVSKYSADVTPSTLPCSSLQESEIAYVFLSNVAVYVVSPVTCI